MKGCGPQTFQIQNSTTSEDAVYLQDYEKLPIQYMGIFSSCKNWKSLEKNGTFLIFAQNIDCGYMLGPPRPGGSNE